MSSAHGLGAHRIRTSQESYARRAGPIAFGRRGLSWFCRSVTDCAYNGVARVLSLAVKPSLDIQSSAVVVLFAAEGTGSSWISTAHPPSIRSGICGACWVCGTVLISDNRPEPVFGSSPPPQAHVTRRYDLPLPRLARSPLSSRSQRRASTLRVSFVRACASHAARRTCHASSAARWVSLGSGGR